ncbi:MAG: 4-hydroxy-tetrahydrodipicolinate reductase [Pirellulaceae bacterium]
MTDATIELAVHGAAGRMGRRVIALATADDAFKVVGAIDHHQHPLLGQDSGSLAGCDENGVSLSSAWPETCDAVIDFSLPEAVGLAVENCRKLGIPLIVATTGLSESTRNAIEQASKEIPIVWAPSMSLAVNLTMKLAQQAAKALKDVPGGADIEIIERHHRFKADAPSGTALKFGELIANELDGPINHIHGREGETGQRSRKEIGYHAVRVGDNTGEHTIVYGMMGETLELRVASSNRDCYASGSLAAARWIQGRSPGLYSMFDVLGLS